MSPFCNVPSRAHGVILRLSQTSCFAGKQSNVRSKIVKSPKLYLADTGLLCALLNIRSEKDLRQSPAAGAVWETFVFAQLRARERRAERVQSLFFWRDRTREVDFVVDVGGRLELFEAKWAEVPFAGDAVNLDFVRNVVGKSRIAGAAIICRRYKAQEAGRRFVAVDPKYISQICSQCGCKHPDNRKTQADFACLSCGYQDNADHNAAVNILARNEPLDANVSGVALCVV
jgi:Domain of unknown function (DUF4143)/Putative transposase DNA-binding domain